MKQEFYEAYEKLFSDAINRLRKSVTLKLKAKKLCGETFNQFARRNSKKFASDVDHGVLNISKEIGLTPLE
jgi:hypothetical protein